MTSEQFEDVDLDTMQQDLNEFGVGIFEKNQMQQLIDYCEYLRAGEKLFQYAQTDPTLANIIREGWPSDEIRDAVKYGLIADEFGRDHLRAVINYPKG